MARTNPLSLTHRSVFRTLLLSMIAFGLLVGILFPPFAKVVLDSDRALSAPFVLMCMFAGFVVGLANFFLFRLLVSRELARLVQGMHAVLEHVAVAERVGEGCEAECELEITSADAIGEIQAAFNDMTEAIARRLGLETATRSLTTVLAASVELTDVSERILESLSETCGAKAGLLYGDTGETFTLLASDGVDRSEDVPRELDGRYGPVGQALDTAAVVALSPRDDHLEWLEQSTPLGTFRPASVLVVPLVAKAQVAGLVILACSADRLTIQGEQELEMLRLQAGPYLQNAILHRRITELAALDDLTGVLNRRFGMRRLEEEFSRSVRHGVPVSVLLIDIDHFKVFNDSFGHDAGDAVLRAVAGAVESTLRAGDVFCRYGGEEFMVVAPGTGLTDGAALGERLRRTIETTQVAWGQQQLSVSVSVGVATWPIARTSVAEELVTAADEALYAAKEGGRNRVMATERDRAVPVSELTAQSARRASSGSMGI